MAEFKLNLSENGMSWKMEISSEFLVGKSIGDVFDGKELGGDFVDYKFKISGGTDFAGFPLYKNVEGIGLRKILFKKGWGMKNKKKGIRLRKTVRGKVISEKTKQINLNVIKKGKKNMEEIFPSKKKEEKSEVKNSDDS